MDLIVPQLSSTMETARVIRWLKKPGDRVRVGEPVLEVETDKATLDVESSVDGVLAEIYVQEGEDIAVGGSIGRVNPLGGAEPVPGVAAPNPTVTRLVDEASVVRETSASPRPKSAGRILASPLARRLAAEAGIDLGSVSGTGPHGRIRKRDLQGDRVGAGGHALSQPASLEGRASTTRPLSSMRARIADAVTASRRTIPSYSLDRWVITTRLNAERRRLASAAAAGVKVTVTDMLLQAVADVLVDMPSFLDRWAEGASPPAAISSASIDIGLVVAVPGGLLIPVVGNLAHGGVADIARSRHQAVERARAGRLSAADSVPAAITLSNLGKSGVDRFEAIINPGQSSILAVGREYERALASEGKLYAATGMTLTLSVDHRLIDGGSGADFLGRLAERIESGSWRVE